MCSALLLGIAVLQPEETGLPTRPCEYLVRVPDSLYHTVAALCGGEEYQFRGLSGELLRLGLLSVWCSLVMQSTYTASLAAFFYHGT